MTDQIESVSQLLELVKDEWQVPAYNQAIVRNFLLLRYQLFKRYHITRPRTRVYQEILRLNLGNRGYVPAEFVSDMDFVLSRTIYAGHERDQNGEKKPYEWPSYTEQAKHAVGTRADLLPAAATYLKLLNMPLDAYMDAVFALRNPKGGQEPKLQKDLMHALCANHDPHVRLYHILESDAESWNRRATSCLIAPLVPIARMLDAQGVVAVAQ